ncbi:hypothetical protein [uncultured Maribacter sp.]|uniref:hypothetical protein n=1 Tax=uncultured Maribacter sp. TaxID=431308 RepID=UPI00262805D7|nr:hypothetical protein [uncultured Maribacter sp.]
MKKYIEVSLGSSSISHRYDTDNNEIVGNFHVEGFSKKIVAIERIKLVIEKYILKDYLYGRWIYWGYKETCNDVKLMLGL